MAKSRDENDKRGVSTKITKVLNIGYLTLDGVFFNLNLFLIELNIQEPITVDAKSANPTTICLELSPN
jgi:hypothetical protein